MRKNTDYQQMPERRGCRVEESSGETCSTVLKYERDGERAVRRILGRLEMDESQKDE